MELVIETPLVVGWTVGFRPDGRELIVVIIKGTYTLAGNDAEPALSAEQAPLTESDEFTGEPGHSATLFESDYAHCKPFCDVVVNGCAHAVGGEPVERVTVGLHIGTIHKRIEVVGDRFWDHGLVGLQCTPPAPFTRMPLSFDRAYGGTDAVRSSDGAETRSYLENPVGVGYYPLSRARALCGKRLANTHEVGIPADKTEGTYRPVSLGPLSRNFRSRARFAGTYDQNWLERQFPFFPSDFDDRYFQCAPADQQIPHPQGGEVITLENLTPSGWLRFSLPHVHVPALFVPHRGRETQKDATLDTIVIEPDRQRLMLTWRVSLAARRNCFEIRQVVVGRTAHAHRQSAKPHYSSIAAFIASRHRGRG